jgi:hypothetical protein
MGAVNLDIFVSDIAAALASFNVIRVRRSTTLPTGPFTEITKVAPPDAATLTGTLSSPFVVVGQTLQLIRDSQPQVNVTFTGTNPLTVDQVKDQINTAAGVIIAADAAGKLKLTSTITGTASKMEIVGGSAAPTLGFTAGQRDIGSDAHIPLVSGVSTYDYTDNDGEAGYWYQVSFFHTGTLLQSAWSPAFQGGPGTQVTSANLSTAMIDMVDAKGVALVGQKISFFSIHQPLQVEGFQVALNRAPVTVETDNAGHAEVTLVRGLKMRVVFHGTSLVRDIEIPNAATFNLLTLVQGAPDPYDIANTNLLAAPRRTI